MKYFMVCSSVVMALGLGCSPVGGVSDADVIVPEVIEDTVAPDIPLQPPADAPAAPDDMHSIHDYGADDVPKPGEVELPKPPSGCCWEDEDCLTDSRDPKVCAPVSWGPDPQFGVCKLAAEEGRCWRDQDCPFPQLCHGYQVCPCNADCDMEDLPGICTVPEAACVPIKEHWVKEYCDAANVVIFDGEKCLATCFGCCWCEPFCQFAFESIDECEAACTALPECQIFYGGCDAAIPENPWWYFDGADCLMEDSCSCEGCPGTYSTKEQCEELCIAEDDCLYIAALMEAPYGYIGETYADLMCPAAYPMDQPCETDADCPIGALLYGGACVLGNCVYCWEDTQCEDDRICRSGRCVEKTTPCQAAPFCANTGCHLVTPSEKPCPVCVCESVFDKECSEDEYCMLFSSHPYSRCVYGRCADCRNDADCGEWGHCLAPGLCYEMTPPQHLLYGTWLIGWAGGMDHFSYFRFEPDGTLRRGHYLGMGPWSDDIPNLPCWPSVGAPTYPLLGTWEPEITASGFLVVRMSLNIECDYGAGWAARFVVNLAEDGMHADFLDVDSDLQYMAAKVPTDACLPGMATCKSPDWTWMYPY